jgi:hypothetical protein
MIKDIIENIKTYGPLEWSIVASIIVVLIILV